MIRTRILALIVALAMATLAGCSSSSPSTSSPQNPPTPKTDQPSQPKGPTGTLTVSPGADVTSLNPLKANDSFSLYAINLIYDPLFEIGPDLKPNGQLVVKTENPNDTTYIFHLRKGVTFHDGKPLTAADVKFTYDFIRDKANGHKNAALWAPITGIEIIDENTVKFTTDKPYAPLVTFLTAGIVPKHIVEANPDQLDTKPIGSGPFKFVQWQPLEKLTLEANENWWVEGEPKVKNLVFRPISEATTRMVALETGSIDVADSVPPAQVKGLTGKGLVSAPSPPNGYYFFAFNQDREPFGDKKVREALTLGLNRAEVTDFVWYGLNQVTNSPIIAGSWAYEPKVKQHPYDAERAKQLLAEAGYPNGLTIQLLHESDDITKRYVEVAQQQWAKIGVKVDLVPKEWGAFFSDVLAADFQMMTLAWVGQDDPDRGLFRQFHLSTLPPNGHNWVHFRSERVTELLDLGRTTIDPAKRAEYYQEVQRIVTDDFTYIYLADYRKPLAHSKRVKDFYYSPYNYFRGLSKASVTE